VVCLDEHNAEEGHVGGARMTIEIGGRQYRTIQDLLKQFRLSRKILRKLIEKNHLPNAPLREITVTNGSRKIVYRFHEYDDPYIEVLRPYLDRLNREP
jgi:hypothetical protein